MRLLITGICGFVGSALARDLQARLPGVEIYGLDNLLRPGSERNRRLLMDAGCQIFHGDIRLASDLEVLPVMDWVIDAAANPSVLAGIDGKTSSRQLVEHNLVGTINLLEFCKRSRAGFFLLSTSRVYSIRHLAGLPMRVENHAFVPDEGDAGAFPCGLSSAGVAEAFPTDAPISLYGATKLASETLALEYGQAFDFPVWINRCGVLAGGGQFGKIDQGIFSFWLHSWRAGRPLQYIGFGGSGHQVRDLFHPTDLAELLVDQMESAGGDAMRIYNIGGGPAASFSLAQLSLWCAERWPEQTRLYPHLLAPTDNPPSSRPFDIPWFVMDSKKVRSAFGWTPQRTAESILCEIADHADANPDWLKVVQ